LLFLSRLKNSSGTLTMIALTLTPPLPPRLESPHSASEPEPLFFHVKDNLFLTGMQWGNTSKNDGGDLTHRKAYRVFVAALHVMIDPFLSHGLE
jgi:hypothetical protein